MFATRRSFSRSSVGSDSCVAEASLKHQRDCEGETERQCGREPSPVEIITMASDHDGRDRSLSHHSSRRARNCNDRQREPERNPEGNRLQHRQEFGKTTRTRCLPCCPSPYARSLSKLRIADDTRALSTRLSSPPAVRASLVARFRGLARARGGFYAPRSPPVPSSAIYRPFWVGARPPEAPLVKECAP